jgi:hypothetical protein
MSNNYFPSKPAVSPKIYAYSDINYPKMLKIGYTTKDVRERVKAQYPIKMPGKIPYKIEYEGDAIRNDGTAFMDHDVHRLLKDKRKTGEWFECSLADVKRAIKAVKNRESTLSERVNDFEMRPEQVAAVEKTMAYFKDEKASNGDRAKRFLWNAKMRFGKTFTTYQLAKKMKWKRLLVLTFKPAVESAWEEDLITHKDFEGWQFISRKSFDKHNTLISNIDMKQPLVCFGSFQDFLGKNSVGGIKSRNEWVHEINWDCIVLDEYHFGSWRETANELFEADEDYETKSEVKNTELYEEDILPITTFHFLYLSGTPFRAISTGEFIEEQIFNWTYADEQSAKVNWKGPGDNPYISLPKMIMMTYKLPPQIEQVALKGEFNEFDLNTFFTAEGEGYKAKFIYEDEVQNWIDLIRGAFSPTTEENLKLGAERPPMPFHDIRLKQLLNHTFWFLPSVASCYAMANLLKKRNNKFYHDFNIIVAAGKKAGVGLDALPPVFEAMGNPLETKTITLSCGKLTTGVTVKPWSGIFMLRNTSSPETYFQAAFRVQSPWTIKNPDNLSPNKEEVIKEVCYVFDFALNRSLSLISEYSNKLNVSGESPEQKVRDFISFLPVLAYDGSSMKEIDAMGILDLAVSGTTATLLARKWESATLVNVDNLTLSNLMANDTAMKALTKIEGFRSLNKDIETIINKSEAVKKAKKEANEKDLSKTEKKEIKETDKEQKKLRKKIQEKLIKFATRIPIFMYLTDYREYELRDVITNIEPELFKKVTGLEVSDFELLVSLNVFNSSLMNDAVFKFRRYEDASLKYTGIERHYSKEVGGYDTTIQREELPKITAEIG